MAKRKTKWRHPHKIKIHDNRWLVWTIAIAVLVCSALIAQIQISEIYFQNQMAETTGTRTWASFNHPSGFSFKYPKNWGLESEAGNTISFVSPTDVNEYFKVSLYPESEERAVKESLFRTEERQVRVGGLNATMISQGTEQPEEIILVKESDRLLVLRGKGSMFSKIVETFKFTQKIERI